MAKPAFPHTAPPGIREEALIINHYLIEAFPKTKHFLGHEI